MTQRNERLNASMKSMDGLDWVRNTRFGDGGRGAEAIRNFEDEHQPKGLKLLDETADAAMLLLGCFRLHCDGCDHLIGTLLAICANRNDVEASILDICRSTRCGRSAARRKYYRQRHDLAAYFGEGCGRLPTRISTNEIKGLATL